MNRVVRAVVKRSVFYNHPHRIDSGGRAIMSAHASDFVERFARSSERNSKIKSVGRIGREGWNTDERIMLYISLQLWQAEVDKSQYLNKSGCLFEMMKFIN